MKTLAKEILRWGVIAASGSCGIWQLIETGRRCIDMRWSGDGYDVLAFFVLIIPLFLATPCLAVTYICLRRQYRKLLLVLGGIGSLAIFVEASLLPEQLGLYQLVDRHIHENHDFAFLGLPLCLLMLFGPIYGATWFFRLCHRLAFPIPEWAKPPRTRATHWLIWVGGSFVLLPLIMGAATMLTTAMLAVKSPNQPISQDSFHSLFWYGELSLLGMFLVFLGLARRQPIPDEEEA